MIVGVIKEPSIPFYHDVYENIRSMRRIEIKNKGVVCELKSVIDFDFEFDFVFVLVFSCEVNV